MKFNIEALNIKIKTTIDKAYRSSVSDSESGKLDKESSVMAIGVRTERFEPEIESIVTSVHDSIIGYESQNELRQKVLVMLGELLTDDLLSNIICSSSDGELKSFKFVLGHDCVPYVDHYE